MDLRELKKEVDSLPNLDHSLGKLKESWIKLLRTSIPAELSALQKMDPPTKKELRQRVLKAQHLLDSMQGSQRIHEKMHQQARYLIELKLTLLKRDQQKSKYIAKQLLQDEIASISSTIADIKSYEEKAILLSQEYEHINELLHKKLSLEETLYFMDLPHRLYLQKLLQVSQNHKIIVRDLGRHFVSLTKSAPP